MTTFDNIYLSTNPIIGVAFDILMIIIMWRTGFYSWKNPQIFYITNYRVTLFCLLLFSVFTFTGDWNHYADALQSPEDHLEDFYQWLIRIIKQNYILFRLTIWGATIFFVSNTSRILGLNKQLFLLILTCYCLVFFPNGRVTLAMAVQFFGLAIIVSRKKFINSIKIADYLLGLTLIIGSFFLHRSALFGIFIIVIGFLIRNISRFAMTIGFMALPIIIIIIRQIISVIIVGAISSEAADAIDAETLTNHYMQNDDIMTSGPLIIFNALQLISNYLCGWIIVKSIYNRTILGWPYRFRIFANVTLLGIIISSLFFFNYGINTFDLRYRLAQFSFFPAVIVLTYCRENLIYNKLIKSIFYISMFMTMFRYLYFEYCAFYKL